MNTQFNSIKLVDWEMSVKLAGGRENLAEDLLSMFIETLPKDFAEISTAYDNKDFHTFFELNHKLKGSTCYCGVPRIKLITKEIEKHMEENEADNFGPLMKAENYTQLEELYCGLETAVKETIAEGKKLHTEVTL